jgi:hypothetical protein
MVARIKYAIAFYLVVGIGMIAILPVRSAVPSGRVLWARSDGPFSSRALLWDSKDLKESDLRLLYGTLSAELKGKSAWAVSVFVDEADAARELHGKLGTEVDYDRWFELYTKYGLRLLPMAEIFAFGEDAVLRLRNGAGVSSETVLSGKNLLYVDLDGTEFNILKIYYHPLPPHTESASGDEAMISIYVRASGFPTVAQAQNFSRLMQTRFHQKRIVVAFRTDSYFLTDSSFPIVYRFDSSAVPPSRRQYESSKTLYCFCDRPEIPCR